jgi:DNA polymerase III sliding clamp (beta) subunit (PCNA family)
MLHVVVESSILKTIVETLMTQVEEARFDFYPDRLEVCAVDVANVAMIKMEANSGLFDTWDLDECKVVMELAKMREVLTLAAVGEMVEINFDDVANRIKVSVGKIERTLSPINEDNIRVPKRVPPIDLKSIAKISGVELSRAFRAAKHVGEIVHMSMSPDELGITVPGPTDAVDVTYSNDELETLTCENKVNSQYSLTYMLDLVKKLDGVNMITLAFGENEPLKMNFGFYEDAITVLFLLAPRQDAY